MFVSMLLKHLFSLNESLKERAPFSHLRLLISTFLAEQIDDVASSTSVQHRGSVSPPLLQWQTEAKA